MMRDMCQDRSRCLVRLCPATRTAARAAGIVDPAIDAFIELLRLQTLGAADLHQVQLDVHAIRQTLSRCVPVVEAVLSVTLCRCWPHNARLTTMQSATGLNVADCLMSAPIEQKNCSLCRHLATYTASHTYDLLDKLVICAAERASDPSLLTPAVIERLLQA